MVLLYYCGCSGSACSVCYFRLVSNEDGQHSDLNTMRRNSRGHNKCLVLSAVFYSRRSILGDITQAIYLVRIIYLYKQFVPAKKIVGRTELGNEYKVRGTDYVP